jgi:hypothetical protein
VTHKMRMSFVVSLIHLGSVSVVWLCDMEPHFFYMYNGDVSNHLCHSIVLDIYGSNI